MIWGNTALNRMECCNCEISHDKVVCAFCESLHCFAAAAVCYDVGCEGVSTKGREEASVVLEV